MEKVAEAPCFLVVDDDLSSRETIVEYLHVMGYQEVFEAKDGVEALKVLDAHPEINFVISDWEMPKLNGLTLLQKIRSSPKRQHLPFLIATSPVSHETDKIVAAAENFVSSYIIKPFRIQTFQDKVKKIVETQLIPQQKKVLLVDDDPDAQAMVKEYLEKLGYPSIVVFSDGRSALDYLDRNSEKVGLIVSDWEMPGFSGLELLKACKVSPILSAIPFLMITSQGSLERMKVLQAARAQVDDYLLKPFVSGDLKQRVDRLFRRSTARAESSRFIVEGLEHLGKARYSRAIDLFERAVQIDPDSDVGYRGLGDAIAKSSGLQFGLTYYKKAVELNPQNPKNYVVLGQAYIQLEMLETAEALLTTAVQEIGFNADIHFYLGWVFQKQGKTEKAKTEFRIVLDIEAEHPEAKVMLEGLERRGNE